MHTHKRHKVLWQRRSARGYTAGRSVRACVCRAACRHKLRPLNTFAHAAARSRRVATELAEQTAVAGSLSSQGVCLLIHTSFALSHNVKSLLVCPSLNACIRGIFTFPRVSNGTLPFGATNTLKNVGCKDDWGLSYEGSRAAPSFDKTHSPPFVAFLSPAASL